MRVHEGSSGWRSAQLSEVMSGCAGAVIGARWVSEAGRVSSLVGKRIGETWGLSLTKKVSFWLADERWIRKHGGTHGQLSLAICARPSTTCLVLGHFRVAGYSRGRWWT